jgi:hypothetical protein
MQMPLVRDLPWLAKALGTAALLVALCGLISRFGGPMPLPAAMVRGNNTEEPLDRYAKNPNVEIAVVGTSYSARLREGFFAHRVRNVSIAGGSNLTGLAVIASYPRLPPLILVESNVLSRRTNLEQVGRYAYHPEGSRRELIRPIRLMAARYQVWQASDAERPATAALLAAAPATYSNAADVARDQAENAEFSLEQSTSNAAALDAAVRSLRAHGSRVVFYELPHQGDLSHSNYANGTRAVMHETFPDQASWLDLDYPPGQLRFADGMHLDARSALLVAQAMDRAIDRLEPARP